MNEKERFEFDDKIRAILTFHNLHSVYPEDIEKAIVAIRDSLSRKLEEAEENLLTAHMVGYEKGKGDVWEIDVYQLLDVREDWSRCGQPGMLNSYINRPENLARILKRKK